MVPYCKSGHISLFGFNTNMHVHVYQLQYYICIKAIRYKAVLFTLTSNSIIILLV